MKNPKSPIYLWFVVAIPFIYLAYRYSSLPPEIPTHYNFKGEADGWSSKVLLWIIIVISSLFSLITMYGLPSMDTSGGLQKMGSKYSRLISGMVIFITTFSCYIISQAGNEQITYFNFNLVLMGGLILIMGNYFPTVRPNEAIGIRTPWAIADEENWRLTHRFGGQVWFLIGILVILSGFLLHPDFDSPVLIVAIVLLIGIPYLYSYWLSQR